MTELVFLIALELRHRLVRTGKDEQGIVTQAPQSPRRAGDRSFANAGNRPERRAARERVHQGENATEARAKNRGFRRIVESMKGCQQSGVVLGVRRALSSKSGAPYARLSIECVDFQPRVVRQGEQPGRARSGL